MARLTRKRLLLAKIETTYGTDPTPTITNAVICGDIQLNGLESTFIERKTMTAALGSQGSVPGVHKSSVSFGVDAAGSGTAGTAPAYGELLRACGLAQTVTAGTKVEYTPVSAGFESDTIYGHEDGGLYKLLGARGTVELNLAVNDTPIFSFSFTGLYGQAPTVVSTPTGTMPTYTTPVAVTNTNSSEVSINGVTYPWQSCTINLANNVSHTPLVGRESVEINDRKPIAKVVMELTATEERTLILLAEAGTRVAFSVTHGTVAGNIIQVDAPKVQLTNPTRQEVDGQMLMAFDLVCAQNAGNDEVVFTIK
jgi:hypothetical protein